MSIPYRTLSIAGSDSGGGAGIQADLKTFAALGCYGMTALTALTAQNTLGVQGVYPIDPAFVQEQIRAIAGDIGADAIKIGMLHDKATIDAVADALTYFTPAPPVVLDPVMVAASGDLLLEADAITQLTSLFPKVTLITPNVHEACLLTGVETIEDKHHQQMLAGQLAKTYGCAVLLKGGHMKSEDAYDCLVQTQGQVSWLKSQRVDTQNIHGTGCTLSSAITAYLARGTDLPDACRSAKAYITKAIEAGKNRSIGQGHGPVHHGVTNTADDVSRVSLQVNP